MSDRIVEQRYPGTRSDGTPAVVIESITMVDMRTGHYTPGFTELTTNRGETLNRRAKGEYEVVGSREIIRCDDPNAP